jgi:hypothetical protein
VVEVVEQETQEVRREAGATQRWIQSCKQCGQPGHNRQTCNKDAADLRD